MFDRILGGQSGSEGSSLGDFLRNRLPSFPGGLLGGIGDVLSGVGNAALGVLSFGQSGTFGQAFGQIGHGFASAATIVGTDIAAMVVGTARYAWNAGTSAADVLTLGNIRSGGNPLRAVGELVWRAGTLGHGNHGGRGIGKSNDPAMVWRDEGSRIHDRDMNREPYANSQWVRHGFSSTGTGFTPDGPISMTYTLLGTVPFLLYDVFVPQPTPQP